MKFKLIIIGLLIFLAGLFLGVYFSPSAPYSYWALDSPQSPHGRDWQIFPPSLKKLEKGMPKEKVVEALSVGRVSILTGQPAANFGEYAPGVGREQVSRRDIMTDETATTKTVEFWLVSRGLPGRIGKCVYLGFDGNQCLSAYGYGSFGFKR